METLGDLVRDRDCPQAALRTGGRREYGYRQLGEGAMRAGNLFRLYGGRRGAVIGIAADPAPETLLSVFGAALLGAPVRFDPPPGADVSLLVAPTVDLDQYDPPPGTTRVGYGDSPDDPEVVHFEREVWRENAAFPPTDVEGETPALIGGGRTYDHATLLVAARRVADSHPVGGTVALRAPLDDPRALVAGVLAPLLAGGTVLLPDGERGDVAVADGVAPEDETISLDAVSVG